jgi:hypothetical protein
MVGKIEGRITGEIDQKTKIETDLHVTENELRIRWKTKTPWALIPREEICNSCISVRPKGRYTYIKV